MGGCRGVFFDRHGGIDEIEKAAEDQTAKVRKAQRWAKSKGLPDVGERQALGVDHVRLERG
jgi:hypothetical protein